MADEGKTLTASRLANDVAPAIADAFAEHQRRFLEITRRARSRFDARDWRAVVDDAVERLDLYGAVIGAVEATIRHRLGDAIDDRDTWTGIKAVYSGLIDDRDDREIAETFFNSVTRRIFATVGVDANIEFVETDADRPRGPVATLELTRVDRTTGSAAAMVEDVVRSGMPGASFSDLPTHAGHAAERFRAELGEAPTALEIVPASFFRRKGAYIVGRALGANGEVPFALALLHDDRGVVVDAVLLGENDLSILFSFTRSHFHVDAGPPSALVAFLKRLMPRKPLAEIYIAIGFHKHGKTELYRDLLRHLATTDGRFDFVPGTPGLVMVVFGTPGYDVVFKIIRDEIPAAKTVTRSSVMQKYRLVFRHDRAGRLVEAQEFEHLRFDRELFTEELVDELRRACGRHVAVTDDAVVVHHAYVERRVTPLDVYVKSAEPPARVAAVVDFGQSIKDLAATNVFPGDLLPKNFGLTRHGRVVCYDYDELGMLLDFTFRDLPESTLEDDAFDEPWFGAAPYDVFPEEFPRFVGLPRELLDAFEGRHRDLYEARSWREIQRRIAEGEIVDIFPYAASRRLTG
ncbi:MAG: bifunctional isocitrate dehydrogenase kinase/phosphatase [Actinomycetota bacterium]